MGSRANIFIVQDDTVYVYYDHWCGNWIDMELLWGPDNFLEFARQRQPVDLKAGLLDDRWCEGGALVDVDGRRLVWFGGEDVLSDLPMRWAHMAMLREVWSGWSVDWAYRGIADLVEPLGVNRSSILSGKHTGYRNSVFQRSDEYPEVNDFVMTMWDGTNAGVWLVMEPEDGFFPEPSSLPPHFHSETLPLVLNLEMFRGGLHVDMKEHRLLLWSTEVVAAMDEVIASTSWPGFQVRWVRDEYERQVREVPGLDFQCKPMWLHCLDIIERANDFIGREGKDPVADIVNLLRKRGDAVQVLAPTSETRGSVGSADDRKALIEELIDRFVLLGNG